jgi:c-di-GMP-binding flagellar brake protein YcgR
MKLFTSYLLQTTGYLAPPDRTSTIILGIIILILILVIIIGNIVSKRGSAVKSRGRSRKRYNKFMFDRMAKDIGFSKKHISTLKKLIMIARIRHPLLLFTNPNLLDTVLKKGIYSIERQPALSEGERIQLLNTIYEIKQTIEYHSKKGIGLKSTYLIKPGQLFTIQIPNNDKYHTKLISNHSNALICSYPVIPAGKNYLFKKNTKIDAFFWRENDSGYSFQSKIIGHERKRGIPSIILQHSKKVKREQNRRFSRKPLKKSCFIYPLQVFSTGPKRHPRKKVVTRENLRHIGVVFNISAGGCKVGCATIHKKGSYIKLEFDIKPRIPVSALGKIQSIKRRPGAGANHVIHVKFVKLSNKSRNHIYSYVYSYI